MFPIRVLVESVRARHCLSCAHDGQPLLDSYAIVSGDTRLSQLVDTVLAALALPQLAYGARGLVQLNNWKPLAFDAITDNLDDTVESLLKDISNHVTLKILTKQQTDSTTTSTSAAAECVADIKDRLLKAAVSRHPYMLSSIKSQPTKDLVLRMLDVGGGTSTSAGTTSPPSSSSPLTPDQMNALNEWLDELETGSGTGGSSDTSSRSPGCLATTTRFNPLLEVPKLERWFRDDANPTRQKLLNYMNVMNASNFRRHHNKINYQQICNWFSNARAMHRQQHHLHQPFQNSMAPRSDSTPLAKSSFQNGDTRHKFDLNWLLDRQMQQPARGSGGDVESMSTTPIDENGSAGNSDEFGDDIDSQPSTNNNNNNNHHLKQESTSSPELSLSIDANESTMCTSPKPPPFSRNTALPSAAATAAAAAAAAAGAARSRLMFDPLTELPLLEKWFEDNPHPSWIQIDQYTETLNSFPYRQSYPPISTHNVKIWFKNRRAKCKRMLGGNEKL